MSHTVRLHGMAESKVTGIEAMVQLRHIDAPLAGLHRSFSHEIIRTGKGALGEEKERGEELVATSTGFQERNLL
jgi:hypothetical protein